MKRNLFSLMILATLFLTACVGQNTYQQKVNEAELLSRDVKQLTSDLEQLRTDKMTLQDELTKLNARLVDVLQQNSKLQNNLLSANADYERQEGNLSRHQEQLLGMQQSNEQLLATVEDLQKQLESEKIAREERLAKVKNTYDQLVGALEDELKRGELTISNLEGRLSVNLLNKILFDSGKTVIKPEGLKVLQSLGDVLNKFPDKALQIEGHTDNIQISKRLIDRFPSNWELSTARANSIVHFLQNKVGLPGARLVAAGFSEYRPVASNEDKEGRAQNRRIQILLTPYKAPGVATE